ncbi:MAG TPA: hypothetical protein VGZ00_10070 [Candidatus Baltobacteraceae bacterium]|nr:hypothetical protein [Candidatus Baltobacteraceae bacterium]
MNRLIILGLTLLLAACAGQASDIGVLNLARLQSSWPKFINYQNQLASDQAAIERSGAAQAVLQSQEGTLRRRYSAMQTEIEHDVAGAAAQVARDRQLKLIVTREFVGYGGIDVTPDVERILKISEKAQDQP